MIIRQIKNIKQQQHILESLRQVEEEDLSSSLYNEEGKRTLNPEMPQNQQGVVEIKETDVQIETPVFGKNEKQAFQKSKLSEEMPLECPVETAGRHQSEENISQGTQTTSIYHERQPRYSTNNHWRSVIPKASKNINLRNRHISEHNSRYTSSSQTSQSKPLERYFRRYDQLINNSKFFDELQLTLKEGHHDEQENSTLKSKNNKSVIRTRLAENLSKFRPQNDQEKGKAQPRYSKSLQIDRETNHTFHTQRNVIMDHYRGKTSAFHSQTAHKRVVPHEIQSIDEQFSTIFGRTEQPKVTDSEEQILPISYFQAKASDRQKITISYKTTLFQLKQICLQDNLNQQEVIIMIPEPLSLQTFNVHQKQEQTFRRAKKLLTDLTIAHSSINIKRYSNCVIIITGNVAIISNFNGKIYLGGWSCGTKIGLALEWQPNKFIYYGEFRNGKRNGVGIYQNARGEIFAGIWKNNIFEAQLSRSNVSRQDSLRVDDNF